MNDVDETLNDLADHIAHAEPHAVQRWEIAHGELTIHCVRDQIRSLIKFLRDDSQCRFETLIDVCGVDFPERRERFEIVYHMLSMRMNQRVRVKVSTDAETAVPSIVEIFPCAEW